MNFMLQIYRNFVLNFELNIQILHYLLLRKEVGLYFRNYTELKNKLCEQSSEACNVKVGGICGYVCALN